MKFGKRKLLEQGRKEYERIKSEEGMRRIRYERNVVYPAEFEAMSGIKLGKKWKCPKCRHGGLARSSSSASKIITWECDHCGWKVTGTEMVRQQRK